MDNNIILVYKYYNDTVAYNTHHVYVTNDVTNITDIESFINKVKMPLENSKVCATIVETNTSNSFYSICYQKINYIWLPSETKGSVCVNSAYKYGPVKVTNMSICIDNKNKNDYVLSYTLFESAGGVSIIDKHHNCVLNVGIEDKRVFYEWCNYNKEADYIIYEKHDLSRGLSFIVRAYNEEKNITYCLTYLKELAKGNNALEIIFVDNNSTDNTFKIAKTFSRGFPNMKVYKYKHKLLRCGKEHQTHFKTKLLNTFGFYTQWAFSKATKYNVIKWDCDWMPLNDNLSDMINKFKLLDRNDSFALWFTGETIFTHNNKSYKNPMSYELYNEPRCFSKLNGFSYVNSGDGMWETAWCDYFVKLDKTKIYHYGRGTHYYYHVVLGKEHNITKDVTSHHTCAVNFDKEGYDKWIKLEDFTQYTDDISLHGLSSYKDSNRPVFLEMKRTNENEFLSRTDSQPIDGRDKCDYVILQKLMLQDKKLLDLLININLPILK